MRHYHDASRRQTINDYFNNHVPINSDAEKVQDMMDDIQEEAQLHNEIADAISRPGQDLYDDVGFSHF